MTFDFMTACEVNLDKTGRKYLRVAAGGQRLRTPVAPQAGPMPVLSQRRHLLGWRNTQASVGRPGDAWGRCGGYSPKYTFLLQPGHMLASPEKVVMLPAGEKPQAGYWENWEGFGLSNSPCQEGNNPS